MNLAFDLNTYDARVTRTMKRMASSGLDALIVNMPDNLNYLCGFDSIGYLWFQALVLSPALANPVFLTRTTEEPPTWETSAVRDGRFYDISKQDPIETVATLLRDAGLADKQIGIELAAFTLVPAHWERLKSLLPEAKFADASTVVAEERLVKSAQEIAYQKNAALMADYAMRKALDEVRPGVSELALAGIISAALGEAGSEYAAIPPMVASGPRSTMIHGMGLNRTIGMGDVVIIEFAGVCRRYHSVLMRTAIVGRPSNWMVDMAATMRDAVEAAIKEVRPGAAAGAPNRACTA